MPKGRATGTGTTLRDWLMENKQGSPYEFFKYMQGNKALEKYHIGNYQSVRTIFYMLSEKLRIIRVVSREERNGRTISLYAIVPGHEYDDAWRSIYRYAYPDLYRVKNVEN